MDLDFNHAPSSESAGSGAAPAQSQSQSQSPVSSVDDSSLSGVLRRRSDDELLTGVRAAAARERGATELVLRYLLEVERRRLYLRRGFQNLFDFCVHELGYCAGSAHMRIQSMRLLRDLPVTKRAEVSSKIASGRLTISQLSNLQTYSRHVGPKGVEPERKLEILARVEGESTRASQRIILQELGVEATALERMRIRGPDQVELTVTLSGEAVELLEEWKALTSHANPEGRHGEAILAALRVAVEQGRKKKGVGEVARDAGRAVAGASGTTEAQAESATESVRAPKASFSAHDGAAAPGENAQTESAVGIPSQRGQPEGAMAARERCIPTDASLHTHEVPSSHAMRLGNTSTETAAKPVHQRLRSSHPTPQLAPRPILHHHVPPLDRPSASSRIPSSIRRLVWHRDGGQCTFVDSRSGRRCLGRRYLEIDHVKPRADGGGHQLENLRLLCGAHHRMRHRAGGAP
ncbi:MAG: hypothetical protein RJB38_729 [Pseudomonadota bacterium]